MSITPLMELMFVSSWVSRMSAPSMTSFSAATSASVMWSQADGITMMAFWPEFSSTSISATPVAYSSVWMTREVSMPSSRMVPSAISAKVSLPSFVIIVTSPPDL